MSDPLFPQGPSRTIPCPRCGLFIPEGAMKCDCGYHFQGVSKEVTSFSPPETRQIFKGPKGKQAWLKAAVFIAFLQGIATVWNVCVQSGIADIEFDYRRIWEFLGLGIEAFLFFAFGIAVLKKHLWGAYSLLGLSSIELITKIFNEVPPYLAIIFVGICVMGVWSLATSEQYHAPTLRSLKWKTICTFALLIYGAGFLTGFVYGAMGFREVMGTMPTYWVTSYGLMTILFWQAGIRSRPWGFETALVTGIGVIFISLLIDVPFNKYQGTVWEEALNNWVFGAWLIIGSATLGGGLSYLWQTSKWRLQQTSRNYLVRNWRGELSLAKTFWVNFFFINWILGLANNWLELNQYSEVSPILYFRILVLTLLIQIPIWLWQIVGLWRASQKHIVQTGHFLWARIAQGIVVFACIYNLAVFPALIEFGKISLGLDEIKEYTIILTDNESEIILEGDIAFGIADKFKRKLLGAPKVWLVHLNSEGGYAQEGKKVHDLLKENQLSTYTQTGCYSACVHAFIAGKERILHEGALLGFHHSSFPGLPYKWLKDEDEKTKQDYLDAGISKEFIEKAFSFSGEEMWFPSLQELIDAGVITHAYDGISLTDLRLRTQ